MIAAPCVRRLVGAAAVALLAALGLITAAPAQAAGATLHVAQADPAATDAGSCTQAAPCETIGAAVARASAGDTIMIGPGTYPEFVQVDKSLTFVGSGTSGPNDTKVTGGQPRNGPASTFMVSSGTVTLQNLDVSGNRSGLGSGVWVGAGATAVTIADCVLSGNHLDGVSVEARTSGLSVRVTGSTLSGNDDAGIYLLPLGDGGGTAQVTVSDSILSDNEWEGAYVERGARLTIESSLVTGNNHNGGLVAQGTMTLTASTVAGNDGPGVSAAGGTVHVDTSTIAQNAGVGALATGGGDLRIANSTVVAGTAPAGDTENPLPDSAAVITSDGGATLSATIVAGVARVPACNGAVTDSGYNLDTDGSCSFRSPSLGGVDPKLGKLGDNGGPTATLLPGKGPATDAIPVGKAGCTSGAADQRGVSRPQGQRCDIGAVEVEQAPITIAPASLPKATVGTAYSATLKASGGLGEPYAWSLADGSSLPSGLALAKDGVLSGTPIAAGTFSFTVSVDDPVVKTYTLTVLAAAAAPHPSGPVPTPGPPGGAPNLANTGSHTGQLLGIAASLLGVGGLILFAAGGARTGSYRRASRRSPLAPGR